MKKFLFIITVFSLLFIVFSFSPLVKDASAGCFWGCGNSAGDPVNCPVGTTRCSGSPASRCTPSGGASGCLSCNDSACCFSKPGCSWCDASRDQALCCSTPAECSAVLTPTPGGGGSTSQVRCGSGGEGIDTAIGCILILIPQGSLKLAGFFLVWGMSIGGGIAFLLVIYAGFLIMTSAGNPQRLSAGRELLTAALSGLLLIIFAAFILRVMGADILGLFS